MNDQCTNVSADQNAKCLKTAKKACQSAVACVQKALPGLLILPPQALDKQFKQIKTKTDLKNLIDEGTDVTEEYNEIVEKCKKDSSKELQSLFQSAVPSTQQTEAPASAAPTPKTSAPQPTPTTNP